MLLHNPCSIVLLEKLTGSQLVKKFPAFCGTRSFITAFTRARHLSLSSVNSIQSRTPHLTSCISILILFSHLQVVSFPQVPHQNPVYTSFLPHKRYMSHPSHTSRFNHPNNIGEEYRSLSSPLCSFLHSPIISSLLGPNIPLNTLNLRSSLNVTDQVSHRQNYSSVYLNL